MLRGALIVWSTNWNYYEKHHKPQQIEMLHSYQRSIKTKTMLAMNSLGMIVNNPGRYLGWRFLERILESLRDVRDSFLINQEDEDGTTDSESENEPLETSDMGMSSRRIVRLLPKPFKYRS